MRALFGADQPRHRTPRSSRPGAGERIRPHARPRSWAGHFPFPVKYGYATVGRVEAGMDALRGRNVFALHPHQSLFNLPAEAVFPIPDGVAPMRAVLAANMETALNAVWDGAPGPADRIAIVGGGLVGLLVAYLCARLPGARGDGHRSSCRRGPRSRAPSALASRRRADAPSDCDLVFHASATAAGLATALRLAGDEATRRRVELVRQRRRGRAARRSVPQPPPAARLEPGRQVAPSHRPRWSHGRRLAAALALLADPALDALIAPAVAFDDLPRRMASILRRAIRPRSAS